MIKELTRIAEKFWTHTPSELYLVGKRRAVALLGNRDNGWDYSLASVLTNPKHMNTKLEIERWERQWRMCRRLGLSELESEFSVVGNSVLEVGCGPVLGFGPIAIFLGAKMFYYREPDFVRSVIESNEVKERYFGPLFQELVANYGECLSFDAWYSRVLHKSQPCPPDATDLIDITLSHSVLEHVPRSELYGLLSDLYVLTKPGSHFCHTVDFGPHGGTLTDLYKTDRRTEQPRLNLYRLSDIVTGLKTAGFKLTDYIPYKSDSIDRGEIHHSWADYSDEDLESRVVLIFGRKAAIG